MTPRLLYNYAEVDKASKMCVGVRTCSYESAGETDELIFVEIPVYDENYIFKYYINGAWYEDAAGTIPWQSTLV